jgi:hypothetical protein
VTRTYRISRAEDGDAVIDLRSMLSRALGLGRGAPDGGVCLTAIADKRMVGSMSLLRPEAPAGTAMLRRLEVEPGHQASGCREALLDVAMRWASANDCAALVVTVPVDGRDFYLSNGFHVVGEAHEPGADRPAVVLRLPLAGARPHSDAWYSKCHGAWFASVVRH